MAIEPRENRRHPESDSAVPFVDAHEVELAIPRTEAWDRLERVVASSWLLGPRGFPRRDAVQPGSLRLAGAHVFARYELRFDLEEAGPGSRIRATTHAKFRPGLGSIYRALVIGSGAHAAIIKRFLKRVAR